MEQSKPTLVEAEGSTYELLARVRHSLRSSRRFVLSDRCGLPATLELDTWGIVGSHHPNSEYVPKAGVEREDVIAFVMPDLPDPLGLFSGGGAAGIVFAINPLLEAPLILDLLSTANAKWLVTIRPTLGSDIWEKVSDGCSSGALPGREY